MMKKLIITMVVLILVSVIPGRALWAQKDKTNALYQAIVNGDMREVERLIDKNPGLLEAKYAGATPLHLVAEKGNRDMAKYLLKKGAQVDSLDYDGATPLHYAAQYGSKEVAELLISKGANINALDNRHRTPLKVAMEEGQKEVEKLLRKYKAREYDADL
jgi:ankyrin repeat protein